MSQQVFFYNGTGTPSHSAFAGVQPNDYCVRVSDGELFLNTRIGNFGGGTA